MNERKTELAERLASVQSRIETAAREVGRSPDDITLIAVTKTYPVSDAMLLVELGQKDFGENRDKEGREKSAAVPGIWHFQGQIQSNKIASIATWADVIHSLDNLRHAQLLAKAVPAGKVLSVFIQVSLDNDPGRGGVIAQDVGAIAEFVAQQAPFRLRGLMAVPPIGEDPEKAFARLAQIHSDFSQQFPLAHELSAGMSGDFEVAIRYGATHVRVGSSILGSRMAHR